MLTATPIDLSILNKSSDTDDKISESLLYCLDGYVPSDLTVSISNLVVDKDTSLRSPLKDINNYVGVENSPNRKRLASTSKEIVDSKKALVDKENLKEESFEIRETDL